jgi:hypothetical protein
MPASAQQERNADILRSSWLMVIRESLIDYNKLRRLDGDADASNPMAPSALSINVCLAALGDRVRTRLSHSFMQKGAVKLRGAVRVPAQSHHAAVENQLPTDQQRKSRH